jgi:hypothetical protein
MTSSASQEKFDPPAGGAPVPQYQQALDETVAKLTPEQRREAAIAVAAYTAIAAELSEQALFDKMLELSTFAYVTPDAADAQAHPDGFFVTEKDQNPVAATQKLLLYKAVRQRVETEYPVWKQDVYKKLFGPGAKYRTNLSVDQFRDDTYGARLLSGASVGPAIVGIFGVGLFRHGNNAIKQSGGPWGAMYGLPFAYAGVGLSMVAVVWETAVVFWPSSTAQLTPAELEALKAARVAELKKQLADLESAR